MLGHIVYRKTGEFMHCGEGGHFNNGCTLLYPISKLIGQFFSWPYNFDTQNIYFCNSLYGREGGWWGGGYTSLISWFLLLMLRWREKVDMQQSSSRGHVLSYLQQMQPDLYYYNLLGKQQKKPPSSFFCKEFNQIVYITHNTHLHIVFN